MVQLALVIGLLITAIAASGVVLPETLLAAVRYILTPLGLYLAAAFRVAFGVVLLLVAPSSRAPTAVRVLGWIVVLAGIATPFIGVDRARATFAHALRSPLFRREWQVLAPIFETDRAFSRYVEKVQSELTLSRLDGEDE